MPDWIPCKDDYRIGDVLRWREPVWKPKARKNSRTVLIGERLITAQVTHCDREWVEFALKSCETATAETWWKPIPELKADKPLKRRRSSLGKRSPKRRPWGGKDGEAARAVVTSKFLS
ncbi:MAG TPA: hypothetical protein VGQ49_11270 [Bryobacteraceae bacterium]|jgi:hypothetical protein|nr:hypothetical protein [Bryobacteraceae bacterium]